jgi:2-(1,2-epoxy-1,2-dihydrophenyl)acetyl-CoA isomerase
LSFIFHVFVLIVLYALKFTTIRKNRTRWEEEMAARNNETDAVIVEHHDDVALVRLNRPRSRNALDPDIKAGLETAIPALMDDSDVRCLVITGSEEAFCAGGDLNNMDDRAAPSVRARMYRS